MNSGSKRTDPIVEELQTEVKQAVAAAQGDSNDDEIDILWAALDLALARWPEVDRTEDWPR